MKACTRKCTCMGMYAYCWNTRFIISLKNHFCFCSCALEVSIIMLLEIKKMSNAPHFFKNWQNRKAQNVLKNLLLSHPKNTMPYDPVRSTSMYFSSLSWNTSFLYVLITPLYCEKIDIFCEHSCNRVRSCTHTNKKLIDAVVIFGLCAFLTQW